MKYYKLTDENMRTYGGFQWELGRKVTTSGKGPLCAPGWIHCYTHPYLAVLLNPIHANFRNPRLFEIEVGGKNLCDRGIKVGWSEVTLVKEVPIPEITTEKRIRFGILCTMKVYKEEIWIKWAKNWLNGKDRSDKSAYAAAAAAADDDDDVDAAAYAAYAAAYANAADAAYDAAYAAAYADAIHAEADKFNLIQIAIQAIEGKEKTE